MAICLPGELDRGVLRRIHDLDILALQVDELTRLELAWRGRAGVGQLLLEELGVGVARVLVRRETCISCARKGDPRAGCCLRASCARRVAVPSPEEARRRA